MASRDLWWAQILNEFTKGGKTGQVTLNFKDGSVASVDVRDHRTPPHGNSVGKSRRVYLPSACGVMLLDRMD